MQMKFYYLKCYIDKSGIDIQAPIIGTRIDNKGPKIDVPNVDVDDKLQKLEIE